MSYFRILPVGLGCFILINCLSYPRDAFAQGAEEGDNVGLQEIVVTAQKRPESAQKTPISMTVLSSDALQQQAIVNVTQLESVVPGYTVSQDQTDTVVGIRGIYEVNTSSMSDPSVAVNVDGVYVSRFVSSGAIFFDLDHIEVLRGPQGTLFGRNADAGALNIITNKPTSEFSAEAAVETGNYGRYGTFALVNGAVADGVDVRGAFRSLSHDGYIGGIYDDEKDVAGRLQALITRIDNVSLLIGANYYHEGGHGGADVILPFPESNPWGNTFHYPDTGHVNDSLWGLHAQLDWDLGGTILTYIPAFNSLNQDEPVRFSGGGNPESLIQTSRENTQELRLASNDSQGDQNIKWLTGLYWEHEHNTVYRDYLPPFEPIILDNYPHVNSTSYAAFGQVTYSVRPNVRVTGGLRYTVDSKNQSGESGSDIASPGTPVLYPESGKGRWTNWSGKAGIEWDVTPRSLAYATVSTGYKAGGLWDGQPGSYGPEHILDYELGSKNRFLSNRLQMNVGAFYYRYTDLQDPVIDITSTGVVAIDTFNAPLAHEYGIESENSYLVTDSDRIDLWATYSVGTFDNFIRPTTDFTAGGNFSGYSMPFVARWASTLAYEHDWKFANGGKLTARAQTHLSAGYPELPDHTPGTNQSSYRITSLSVGYTTNRARWSFSAYVNNLENRAIDAVPSEGYPYNSAQPNEPRVFGIRIDTKF
jgi:iron complex outermembrane receptor protein